MVENSPGLTCESQKHGENVSMNEVFQNANCCDETQTDGWTMENEDKTWTKPNEQWKPPPAANEMSMEPKGCID